MPPVAPRSLSVVRLDGERFHRPPEHDADPRAEQREPQHAQLRAHLQKVVVRVLGAVRPCQLGLRNSGDVR